MSNEENVHLFFNVYQSGTSHEPCRNSGPGGCIGLRDEADQVLVRSGCATIVHSNYNFFLWSQGTFSGGHYLHTSHVSPIVVFSSNAEALMFDLHSFPLH